MVTMETILTVHPSSCFFSTLFDLLNLLRERERDIHISIFLYIPCDSNAANTSGDQLKDFPVKWRKKKDGAEAAMLRKIIINF